MDTHRGSTRQRAFRQLLAWALPSALLLVLATGWLSPSQTRSRAQERPLVVVTTVFPLYEWALAVGGSRVRVTNLVPTGVEPHAFEPTPRDVVVLRAADLVIYPAAGFQPAVEAVLEGLPSSTPTVLNASEGLPLLEDEQGHPDPHTWLSPVLAVEQVRRIAEALGDLDPENREVYRRNASVYVAELHRLDREFRGDLASCPGRTFFVSHDAFGYLAREYGLTQVPIAGLSPEREPSPRRLAELVLRARREGARYVFFETLASPQLAQTLAREAGAEVLPLNPLEGLTPAEAAAGETYLSIMRRNLENLRLGLGCGASGA